MAGNVVTLALNMSEVVNVTGTPTLTLNDGGTATYTGGTGTNALTFSYTVGMGQNTSDLAVTAINLNSATVHDGAGNAANLAGALTNPAGILQVNTTEPPMVTTSTINALPNQTLAGSSLFSVSDPNGYPITEYQFGSSAGAAGRPHLHQRGATASWYGH